MLCFNKHLFLFTDNHKIELGVEGRNISSPLKSVYVLGFGLNKEPYVGSILYKEGAWSDIIESHYMYGYILGRYIITLRPEQFSCKILTVIE